MKCFNKFILTLGLPYGHDFCLIIDPFFGSVVQGGASLLGSLFNFGESRATRKMQERMFNTQMDYVKAAEQRQYDYQDKAWQRETEYNSPVAQRQRFEAAGLNPAMMMEGQNAVVGSMGEPSSPSAPSPPTLSSPQLDLSGIGQAVGSYYQNALLQSQMNKTDREAYLVGVEGEYAHQKHQMDLKEQLARIENLGAQTGLSASQRSYYNELKQQIVQAIAFNDATWNARMQQENKKAYLLDQQGQETEVRVKKLVLDNLFARIEHELNIDIARATKRRIESQILVDNSQINLNDAEAKKLAADYSKTILEAAELSPGSDQWKDRHRLIKAQIYNLLKGKLNILGILGVDVPQTTSGWVFGDD